MNIKPTTHFPAHKHMGCFLFALIQMMLWQSYLYTFLCVFPKFICSAHCGGQSHNPDPGLFITSRCLAHLCSSTHPFLSWHLPAHPAKPMTLKYHFHAVFTSQKPIAPIACQIWPQLLCLDPRPHNLPYPMTPCLPTSFWSSVHIMQFLLCLHFPCKVPIPSF